MTETQRFQIKRRKGFHNPPNGRRVCRGTIFGNPFPVTDGNNAEAVRLFREWLLNGGHPEHEQHRQRILDELHTLTDKVLGCFCSLDKPCHADVLTELLKKGASK